MDSAGALLLAALTWDSWGPVLGLVIAIAILVVPYLAGVTIANWLRMRDYGWKIGLILCAIAVACLAIGGTWDPETKQFRIKKGVDLQGGVILIYEVEQSVKFTDDLSGKGADDGEREASDFSMSALIEALSRRINPAGTKEIVIRPYGERQVEIIIPEVDQVEVDQIQKTISTAGVLQFRIVANSRDHRDLIDLARAGAKDPIKKRSRVVYDEGGNSAGLWARVGRETKEVQGVRPFKVAVGDYTVRDAFSGDLLDIPPDVANNPADRTDDDRRLRLALYAQEQGLRELDVLMHTDDGLNVNGSHLGGVMRSVDELMKPCIHFSMKGVGANLFGALTERNSPEGQFHRQLGIVLDNELLSAPNIQERISDRGRITGQFTDEEVQFLVNILQAGSLPVVLNKEPISKNLINPLLGKETIEQGKFAMTLATILVFLFMLFYYRFSGVLACIVLALNILFTMAMMILIKAPITLPGLAGLVLTVGMSVDANVLIYERIREELARGAALRMALRNGFARATTTIIDSNLTTILTAMILYAIGTDQLRGFAVMLILGIITSMFTAIFCSRVFFDISERTWKMNSLNMFQFMGATKIDFVGYRRLAVGVSLLLIGIGAVACSVRGKDLLDIDFTGGSSVHVLLEKPAESEEVRKLLDGKFQQMNIPYTLTGMSMTPGQTMNNMFKVDAKLEAVEELQKFLHDAFQQSGGALKLATYSLKYSDLRETSVETTPKKTDQPAGGVSPVSPTAESPLGAAPAEKSAEPANSEKPAPEANSPAKADDASQEAKSADPPAPSADKKESSVDSKEAEKDSKEAEKTDTQDSDPKAGNAAPQDPAGNSNKDGDGASTPLPRDTLLAFAQDPPAADKSPATPPATPKESAAPAADKGAEPEPPAATTSPVDPAKTQADPAKGDAAGEGAAKSEATKDTQPPPATEGAPATESPAPAAAGSEPARSTLIEVKLEFGQAINAATLRAEIDQAAADLKIPLSYTELNNPQWDGIGSNSYTQWTLRVSASEEDSRKILDRLQAKFSDQPVWPSSSTIGPTVAGRMQRTAITALVASWVAIIVYLWIRFQNLVFGLAAVVALVHDVLITITALAVSHWLTGALGFLLIEDFKISLTIVAALLTIIGYSTNDTIVIFDRIREVRGKSPEITAAMVNLSVNQTLSRTLLTFFTTFIVVVVLYGLGGQGIHGFAFAMVIGMVTGTYSTVFVATPFVLWLAGTSIDSPSPKAVAEKVGR
jgi:SecD/SecF fusion protein